jgi:predicted nucleotidyltransferase
MELIKKYISEIKKLCNKHQVAELYVFGSVTKENFSPTSDIDFLVRFENVEPREYFDNYMNFKEMLESLLSRDVDLVEIQTVKNPILKRSIDRDKILLYGREDSKVAV